jgi:hypothetical protein
VVSLQYAPVPRAAHAAFWVQGLPTVTPPVVPVQTPPWHVCPALQETHADPGAVLEPQKEVDSTATQPAVEQQPEQLALLQTPLPTQLPPEQVCPFDTQSTHAEPAPAEPHAESVSGEMQVLPEQQPEQFCRLHVALPATHTPA